MMLTNKNFRNIRNISIAAPSKREDAQKAVAKFDLNAGLLRDKAKGMILSYVKDLVVAGKIEIVEIENIAKLMMRVYDEM